MRLGRLPFWAPLLAAMSFLELSSVRPVQAAAFFEQFLFSQLKSMAGDTRMDSSGAAAAPRQLSGSWSNCLLCKTVVSIVYEFFTSGKSEEDLVSVLEFGCKTFNVESHAVCEGIIPRFREMLFTVIARSPLPPHDICSLVFAGQCGEPTSKANWTVPTSGFPKPDVKPVPLPQPNAPTIRIAHLADTHVDTQYSPNASVDCADPLCCRVDSTLKSGGSSERAGFWGSFNRCDIPERTLQASLAYIGAEVKPQYIYFTGDIMPHNVWQSTREENQKQFQRILDDFKTHLPGVQVIPAMGNHEGVPVNSFPTPDITGNMSVKWLYDTLADIWSFYIPEQNLQTFREGGYFSYDLTPQLRVISLNMNYCNTFNWWILINSTDPTNQLQWLTDQLQDCENRKFKVHLLAHIPPGHNDCLSIWSRNFNDILNRYEGVIAAQFYGHTHNDEFAVFFDADEPKRAYSTAFIAPSITTFNSGNPTVRVYTVDGQYDNSTYQVLDYANYAMDLALANDHPDDSYVPEWNVIPSMKKKLKMDSMQPKDFAKLAKRLQTDEDAFADFFKLFVKNMPNATFTPEKRKEILCRLIVTRSGTPCPL